MLRLERTASLLARARAWLRDEQVLAAADPVLRRAVGTARHKAHSPNPPCSAHSARNTRIESTRIAVRAGRQEAARDTARTAPDAPARTIASVAATS